MTGSESEREFLGVNQMDVLTGQVKMPEKPACDHDVACCIVHQTHVTPHVACILR